MFVGDIQFQEGYVMPTSYFTSLIEQNARRIALVQQSGTKLAGIDIQNGIVNLFGDRVTFSNADGTIKNKVWIDPETGTIHAVEGVFSGLVKKTKTLITQLNISDYQYESIFGPVFDFDKAGTYIVFSDLTQDVTMYAYGVWGYTSNNDAERKEFLRGLVGNRVLIYNKSSRLVNISGHTVMNGNEVSFSMGSGKMCSMECKIRGYGYDSLYPNREGYEDIYWDCTILKID